jgi:olefin beta-lactone synthetase
MMKEDFNIVDLFFDAAARYPLKPAIIYQQQVISFAQLEREVKATASYLVSKGLKPGDRVLIFVPMSIDLYRIVLAIFSVGATAVFLDEWVSKKRMEECCRIADCKAFVGILKARIFSWFSSELRKIPIKLSLKGSSNEAFVQPRVSSTGTALITFTTGSTGIPKAAKRTHQFLYYQFSALKEKINPQPGDIDMPVLPIVLLINLGAGCTSVVVDYKAGKPHLMKANAIIEIIRQQRVSRMVASPFFVKQLSKSVLEAKVQLPDLKKIFTGGAPVFSGEAALYQKAFPDAHIEIVYGSTEAEPISSILAGKLLEESVNDFQQGLPVGIPYSKATVRIIDMNNGAIVCNNRAALDQITKPVQTIGEIIVSGLHVLDAYYNNEEALRLNKIFVEGVCWHRTGDSGYLDAQGRLFLTGRCSALIHWKGRLISPFICENYLQQIEGVELGTIVNYQEQLLIVVETSALADKKLIEKSVQELPYGISSVKFLRTIPRDPRHHSKIDYASLSGMLH